MCDLIIRQARRVVRQTSAQPGRAEASMEDDPERVMAFGPRKVMKSGFCSATALHGSVALPFVIPSAAEGSAVQRTYPGNVF
jgi:hypothetical protein